MALQKSTQPSPPRRDDIAIGHDIVALISSAMYTEPLTIFRELCQNSADAIDEAVATHLIGYEAGRVEIFIDPLHRSVIVRDNGPGVPNDRFAARMCSIGASRKRGTGARGFRGIGRLVALGYCQELVFRSRARGDAQIHEAAWDCRALREALRSASCLSLVEVIERVVTITGRRAAVDERPHFFEVELRKVVRLADDALLNPSAVESYLSEVGPVPFHASYSAGSMIAQYLRKNGGYDTLAVRINGRPNPITRRYRDVLALSSTKSAQLQEPLFFEVPSQDGELAAVGWIAHHEYLGAFPRHLGVRGLRARVGNLQIGGDSCFDGIFSEQRFNDWTIGEVHIIDPRIVPNGRRDYFEVNVHFENLCNHLVEKANVISRRCRSNSASRRKERSLADLDNALTAYSKLLKRNRVARILRNELLDDVLDQIKCTRKKLSSTEQCGAHIKRIEERIRDLAQVENINDARATQRQMGQADVLRTLRERIPGGTATSFNLLKFLGEDVD